MKTIIVLAMHGSTPKDFPKKELIEYFGLHSRLKLISGPERKTLENRYKKLELKIRSWPRTKQNDPYFFASNNLADNLQISSGNEVIVGFNEFCNPSLEDSLNKAIANDANRIIVITPMMTPGGEHSEIDIPATIKRVKEQKEQLQDIEILYAWPFEVSDVANFLASQIEKKYAKS